MEDKPNPGIFINHTLVNLISSTFPRYNQIPDLKIRFHAVAGEDHISCLPTQLDRAKYKPEHENNKDENKDLVSILAGESEHDLLL